MNRRVDPPGAPCYAAPIAPGRGGRRSAIAVTKARACFAIPGDIETLTGGYGYDRRAMAAANGRLEHVVLPDDFPFPSPASVAATVARLNATPNGAILLIDGLAHGAIPPDALDAIERPIVALTHHPLGLETGLDAATSARLIANERAALARARAVIVTSDTTRDTLVADFGVGADRITVAEPGVDPAPRARGSGGGGVALLAIGAIVRRKGFDVLVEALAPLRGLDWRLTIVGSAERDRETAAALRARIDALGLSGRIDLPGEMGPERLGALRDGADLFVLSSHYEGYGMVLAEAMARGLPIVSTTGGAAARTVPDEAALKVPPGDAPALSASLARAIGDASLRARLADASWRAGALLPRWDDCATTILSVVDRVAGEVA